MTPTVRDAVAADDIAGRAAAHWGEPTIVVHGAVHDLRELPAVVAEQAGVVVGVLTYVVGGTACEIVSCDADPPGLGTGRALVSAVVERARSDGCRRVWCTTTNDNLAALGFWQAVGFRLVALRPDAVAAARARKPSIPMIGHRDLPIRDELDLELLL